MFYRVIDVKFYRDDETTLLRILGEQDRSQTWVEIKSKLKETNK